MPTPNIAQLKQALVIAEQIEKLQAELANLFDNSSSVPKVAAARSPGKKRGKRTMSAEARAKIAAAQRARWAKAKGASASTAKAPALKKTKRKLSPEGRARIVAALKARWAAKKKAQK